MARGDQPFMSKADLDHDPAQIKPLLPLLALMKLSGPPLRVLYRLFGTSLAALYGITEVEVGENWHLSFAWAFFPLSSDGMTIAHTPYIKQRSKAKPGF